MTGRDRQAHAAYVKALWEREEKTHVLWPGIWVDDATYREIKRADRIMLPITFAALAAGVAAVVWLLW